MRSVEACRPPAARLSTSKPARLHERREVTGVLDEFPAGGELFSVGASWGSREQEGEIVADVTVASFAEMEPIFDGIARRARATLGVTGWGMQVMTLPPRWDGYPNHLHDANVDDANQEEVYIPLQGSGTLHAGDEEFELKPGMMARVGPEQRRKIAPGDQGIQFIALGAVPGSFTPSPWSELGGPLPVPRDAG